MTVKRRKYRKDKFAIEFYENILKSRPDFIEALSCLGNIYTRRGDFRKGLEVDLRLAELKPDDPLVFYNLACSYSLLGNLDKALESLKKAVLFGYNDFTFLFSDKDLSLLRKYKPFTAFVKKINKKLLARKSAFL